MLFIWVVGVGEEYERLLMIKLINGDERMVLFFIFENKIFLWINLFVMLIIFFNLILIC